MENILALQTLPVESNEGLNLESSTSVTMCTSYNLTLAAADSVCSNWDFRPDYDEWADDMLA